MGAISGKLFDAPDLKALDKDDSDQKHTVEKIV